MRSLLVGNFNPRALIGQSLFRNKNKELARLEGLYRNLLKSAGVEVFEGRAVITGAHSISVNEYAVIAKHILIATGSWPVKPQIP